MREFLFILQEKVGRAKHDKTYLRAQYVNGMHLNFECVPHHEGTHVFSFSAHTYVFAYNLPLLYFYSLLEFHEGSTTHLHNKFTGSIKVKCQHYFKKNIYSSILSVAFKLIYLMYIGCSDTSVVYFRNNPELSRN